MEAIDELGGQGAARAWLGAMLLLFAVGCGDDNAQAPCTRSASAPLFNGSPDPAGVSLNPAERAAIGAIVSGGGTTLCTATVIDDGWAITAAHCLVGAELLVRSGAGREPFFRIIHSVVHPELDVMLVALEPLKAVEITPIPLWEGTIDERWIGTSATLAGVGTTETGSMGELRFVDESITRVQDSEIWVDGKGRSGACSGDSGGPLLVSNQNGEARATGVLDRGSPDCLNVDVYTRADVLREWAAPSLGRSPAAPCGE